MQISDLGISRSICEIIYFLSQYIVIKIWYIKKFREEKSWFSYNIEAL